MQRRARQNSYAGLESIIEHDAWDEEEDESEAGSSSSAPPPQPLPAPAQPVLATTGRGGRGRGGRGRGGRGPALGSVSKPLGRTRV